MKKLKMKVKDYLPFFDLGGKFTKEDQVFDAGAIVANDVATIEVSGTTSGTAGTVTTHAHGLGYAPKLLFVKQGNAYITAVDATNISVASTAVSAGFVIAVIK